MPATAKDIDLTIRQDMGFRLRTWGDNVRRRRREMRMSQDSLARSVGVHQQTICKIERAQMTPSDEVKVAICYSLRCQVEDLFPLPTIHRHRDPAHDAHMARWSIGHRCAECFEPVQKV